MKKLPAEPRALDDIGVVPQERHETDAPALLPLATPWTQAERAEAAGRGTTAWSRIRLRHLQCFVAVARLGRLQAAAESLAVTQPAVTKTLNELEDIVGTRLLERSRRGVVLTPAGQAFMPHAGACLDALGQALASVLPDRGQAPLRVGALPTVAMVVLRPVIEVLQGDVPDCAVQVVTDSNPRLLAQLHRGELDAVVGRISDPGAMPGLSFELLYAEPLALVVRTGHPLARRRRLAPRQLAGQRLVLPPADTLIGHAVDSYLRAHGMRRPPGGVETLSVSLARGLVLQGDWVWFTAPGLVEADLASGLMHRLPLDTAGTEEPVGLLLRSDREPDSRLRLLVGALREVAAARRAGLPAVAPMV